MFLKRLQMAKTALAQAVFHTEVCLSLPCRNLRRKTRGVRKFGISDVEPYRPRSPRLEPSCGMTVVHTHAADVQKQVARRHRRVENPFD